jgi:hypothetical protein
MSKQIIWTSKIVEEKVEQISQGEILKNIENPFHDKIVGLRKSGISFRMTKDEIDEYIKCKMDIQYFAENYCWVKGEQGEPVKIILRDYQKEILDNFFKERYNILMASRQVGKCFSFNTLCEFKINEKTIYLRIGILYYLLLSQTRKLTFLEKLKIKIYETIFLIEGKPSF